MAPGPTQCVGLASPCAPAGPCRMVPPCLHTCMPSLASLEAVPLFPGLPLTCIRACLNSKLYPWPVGLPACQLACLPKTLALSMASQPSGRYACLPACMPPCRHCSACTGALQRHTRVCFFYCSALCGCVAAAKTHQRGASPARSLCARMCAPLILQVHVRRDDGTPGPLSPPAAPAANGTTPPGTPPEGAGRDTQPGTPAKAGGKAGAGDAKGKGKAGGKSADTGALTGLGCCSCSCSCC